MKLNKFALFVGLGFAATACGSDGGSKDPETEGNVTPAPDAGTNSAPDAGTDGEQDGDAGNELPADPGADPTDPTCYIPDAPLLAPDLFQTAQVSLDPDMNPVLVTLGGVIPSEENGNVGGYASVRLVSGKGVFADGIEPGTYSFEGQDPTDCGLCLYAGASDTGDWISVGGTMTIETVGLATGDTFKASTTGVTLQGAYHNEDDPELVPILKENCAATIEDITIEVDVLEE